MRFTDKIPVSDICDNILELCHTVLDADISPADVSIAHRLPKGCNDKVWPVVVCFTNRKARNQVYAAHGKQQNYNASSSTDPVYICHKLWKAEKIAGKWSYNGKTYVKLLNSGTIIDIFNRDDTGSLLVCHDVYVTVK